MTSSKRKPIESDPEVDEILKEAGVEREFAEQFLEDSPIPSLSRLTARLESAPALLPGDKIGDYVLVRELGRGGFATVFLARQVSLGREIALKISADRGREAQILASLDHDNIVRVYSESVEKERNLRLLGMQYVEGTTLGELMDELSFRPAGKVDGAAILEYLSAHSQSGSKELIAEQSALPELDLIQATLWIGAQLANALAYAHQRGVLHLDVKPSNVLLNRAGKPLLTDFNVSWDHRAQKGESQRFLGGTLEYMAPEQMALLREGNWDQPGAKLDHRADLYSLGVVIGELLDLVNTHQRVPGSKTVRLTTGLKEPMPPLPVPRADRWANLDQDLRTILRKCTATAPEARYQSASELARAFEGCLELRAIAKALPPSGRLLALTTRHPRATLFLVWMLPVLLGTTLAQLCFWVTMQNALPSPRLFGGPLGWVGDLCLTSLLAAGWKSIMRLAPEGKEARARLLAAPDRLFSLMTLVWLPGILAVMALSYHQYATLSAEAWAKILVCSGLSGLTAAGYSSLLALWTGLRVAYPKLWEGEVRIQQTATAELESVGHRFRPHFLLITLSPFAAAMMFRADPLSVDDRVQLAISLLLTLSLTGILFSFSLSHRLAQFVFAFTGRHQSVKRG